MATFSKLQFSKGGILLPAVLWLAETEAVTTRRAISGAAGRAKCAPSLIAESRTARNTSQLSHAISGYLSVKIVEELMYKKCDLQVNSPCSSVAELCCIWLKIFCQAWHLFHGAHSHCKAVKLSCCLRPWHTFSSLRKYTRVMLQATHSNSVVPLLEAKAALCWATSHQTLQSRRPNCSRGKLIPVWSCMILTLASCLRVFSNSNGEETHVGAKWS